MSSYDYNIAVIGSGPAGQRAAVQAAKLGKSVVLIERQTNIGGVMLNTGTIPSKTMREAILHLTGYRERSIYGESYSVKQNISMQDILVHTNHVMGHEMDVLRNQLLRNNIELITATASFKDPHTIHLLSKDSNSQRLITAEKIVIAVGTSATKPKEIPIDGKRIFITDEILRLSELPSTLAIIGAGVIGLEYGSMLAALGIRVTFIDKSPRLLTFVDTEIIDTLVYHMRQNRVTLRLNEEVSHIEPFEDEQGPHVKIFLASGKQIVTESALYSIGRTGATSSLNLTAAGLEPNERGRLEVNNSFQTTVSHIYAAGDVIGFPSLASTSGEQGRIAAAHAFGLLSNRVPDVFPYGIYTIPEISMIGRTEEDLTNSGVPYECGKAQYREIARGQIIGDETGLLKLLFHLETRQILGIHIIGEGASELVHIGQAVLSLGGTLDYFIETVFNYPTLAECYKTAALDGINRLSA